MNRVPIRRTSLAVVIAVAFCLTACGHSSSNSDGGKSGDSPQAAGFPPAPAPESTGGFDGSRAYKHVEQLVAIGPHTAGSDGIHRAQTYIIGQLKSFGCPVEEQDFHAPSTPVGDVAMKNIVVKIPSSNPSIILYGSHYDTKRIDNFVGADDAGSSTAVLLEFARIVCKRKNAETIWLAFFDGEEAFNFQWADPDNTYGSREMAASLALSGELPRVKAMILVDMVGPTKPVYRRESYSTPWLTDIVWSTAARLGYGKVFVNDTAAIEDDHQSFLNRGVPAVDIIDLDVTFWHTPQDTLDKIDPRTLAITGHVLAESLPEIEKRINK